MLKLENISFSADTENGKKEILKDITLEIDGGFTAITGPNGGGKSTLAKIIFPADDAIYIPCSGSSFASPIITILIKSVLPFQSFTSSRLSFVRWYHSNVFFF